MWPGVALAAGQENRAVVCSPSADVTVGVGCAISCARRCWRLDDITLGPHSSVSAQQARGARLEILVHRTLGCSQLRLVQLMELRQIAAKNQPAEKHRGEASRMICKSMSWQFCLVEIARNCITRT